MATTRGHNPDRAVQAFAKNHEKTLKKREKSRATKDVNGREVTDIRAIEETVTGADFVKEILARDEPEASIFIEKRITHHIYGHRDIQLARRFANL